MRLLNEAIDDDIPMVISWIDNGRPYLAEIELIDLHEDEVHGYNLDHNATEVLIPLDAIIEISPSEPVDDDLYDDEDPL
jgi:hypothetical protein